MDTPTLQIQTEKSLAKNDQTTVEIHSNVVLKCLTESSNPPEFIFTRNGSPIPHENSANHEHLNSTTNFFSFLQISYEDAGKYACSAKNEVLIKSSTEQKLRVIGPCNILKTEVTPVYLTESDGSVGEEFTDIKLTCQIDENVEPKCDVDWKYDPKIYKNGMMERENFVNLLKFKNFEVPEGLEDELGSREDPGQFFESKFNIFCRAKNSYGKEW